MEYKNELKRLEEGGNYWKPKAGQFKVKALGELEEAEPFVKKDKEGKQDGSIPQMKLKILVNNEEKVWTFGLGATLGSTYGQLIKLASEHAYALTNVEFTVAVKNDGKKNDYTIVNQ